MNITSVIGNGLITATLSRFGTNDATTSKSVIYKDRTSSTFGGASYQVATSTGTYIDTYVGSAAQDWSMVIAAFKAATSTAGAGATTTATTTSTLFYDNNGNLTAERPVGASATTTYTWDYRNRLTQSATGLATSTYAYDDQGNRVKLAEGSVTTFIPNTLYNAVTGATSTKHIFANGILLATIESTGTTTTSGGSGGSTSTSTPAYVQSGVDSDSAAVTLGSAVTTGNLIVVGITTDSQSIPSNTVSDNKGNTYTRINEVIKATNHTALFYAKNVTGGSSFSVSSGISSRTMSVAESSGVATSSPFDKVASSTGTSVAPNSGSVTTTVGPELFVGLSWSGGSGDTWTPGYQYTIRQQQTDNATHERLAYEDKVVSSATTTIASYTTTTADDWTAIVASFKPLVTTSGGTGTTTTASTTIRYVHTDNLGGTSVITDATGALAEALDYYPYGAARVDSKVGSYQGEKRKYAGTEADSLSGLNYMMARYQNSNRGQFISQDPVFLNMGNAEKLKQITNQDQTAILTDPQLLNSYSYARGNPINQSDTNGTFVDTALDLAFIANDLRDISNAKGTGQNPGWLYAALTADVVGAVVPGATGLGLGVKATEKATSKALDVARTINKNANNAVGNFGLYEIRDAAGNLYKIGKADLERITQSSGLPTRLHQQLRKLNEGLDQAQQFFGRVVDDLGVVTTKQAKDAETNAIQSAVTKNGNIPIGNSKSFPPN